MYLYRRNNFHEDLIFLNLEIQWLVFLLNPWMYRTARIPVDEFFFLHLNCLWSIICYLRVCKIKDNNSLRFKLFSIQDHKMKIHRHDKPRILRVEVEGLLHQGIATIPWYPRLLSSDNWTFGCRYCQKGVIYNLSVFYDNNPGYESSFFPSLVANQC